jgi:hypothetical protein
MVYPHLRKSAPSRPKQAKANPESAMLTAIIHKAMPRQPGIAACRTLEFTSRRLWRYTRIRGIGQITANVKPGFCRVGA